MFNILFYNLFQISKQARVASKVAEDDHHQLIGIVIINNKIGVGANINLEFGRVEHKKGILFMAFIWLRAFFDMIMPLPEIL